MKEKEPKMLSEYLRTENGKKTLAILKDERDKMGERPCKECAGRFVLYDEAFYVLDEACANAEPGFEDFDMEVNDALFAADPEDVAASVRSWLEYNEYAWDLMAGGDAAWEARRYMWRDYWA